jgi:glycosyltransferase involved in cell wall biosynthesis
MIPTHDCAAYLRETLASVLIQDPGPERMQIEVVDDASSDGPESVVEELGRGRAGFHRQPRNVGHVANFNTCLERSRGRLVQLLPGDDCVREGFYEAMGRLLDAEGEAGARSGGMLRSGENVEDLRRVIEINREHLPPERADELTRRALRETATPCLRRARRVLGAGDTAAMWAQVREALRTDVSARVIAEAAVVVAARYLLAARRRPDP